MTLNSIIKNIITFYTELDEIYARAKQAKFCKTSSIDRELRRMSEDGDISPVFKKNYIIGYKPKVEIKKPHKPVLKPIDILNNDLRDIMQSLDINQDRQEILYISNVINSKNLYNKQKLIQKYE